MIIPLVRNNYVQYAIYLLVLFIISFPCSLQWINRNVIGPFVWLESSHIACYIREITHRNFRFWYANFLLMILKSKHWFMLPPCTIQLSSLMHVEITPTQLSLLVLNTIHGFVCNVLKSWWILSKFSCICFMLVIITPVAFNII